MAEVGLEEVRAYWDRRPCNIRHSPQPVGTRAYFDEVEARKYFVERHIPAFADFPRWTGKRVLEIGCGIGTDAGGFARAGALYHGMDLSEESLKLARQRFEVFGLEGQFHLGDAEQLSAVVAERGFDLIYAFGSIHHTPRPGRALAEARKLIAPDGELRAMLYAKGSWKDLMIAAGLDQPEAQAGCPVAWRYTQAEATELLAQAGFEVVRVDQTHIFPYEIAAYLRYEYVVQPWFAAMPGAMFEALERAMGWHLLIQAGPI